MFGSALLRCELAWDRARGFESGIGCSGMILMTRDGRRPVRIGRTGVGMVMVVTKAMDAKSFLAKLIVPSWNILHTLCVACSITFIQFTTCAFLNILIVP